MRISLNLASEPFRRDRPIVLGTAVLSGFLLIGLVTLISLVIGERQRSAEARETLARMNGQMRTIAAEQAKLEAVLREPQNAEVLDKTRFVNTLLLRKGVSWTRMFEDLERVMPHNVRLIQVRPQINAQNDVLLDMVVGAQTSEPVLTLLMSLEGAAQFGATTVHNWLPPTQTEPLFRYRVSVQYGQKL